MKTTTQHREAEIALGARSRHQAEAERKLVDPPRFEAMITEFIEWRTFAYWVRLVVEIEGGISTKMQKRCSMSDVLVLLPLWLPTANLIPTRESFSGFGSSTGSTTPSSSPQAKKDGGMRLAFMRPRSTP